jgi:hypothetical protein
VLDDDTLKCWGSNAQGQLGLGDTTDRLTPAAVNLGAGRTAKSVSAAYHHTCAVLGDDTLKCWGFNLNGELGVGDLIGRRAPVTVKFSSSTGTGPTGPPGPPGSAAPSDPPAPAGPPGLRGPPASPYLGYVIDALTILLVAILAALFYFKREKRPTKEPTKSSSPGQVFLPVVEMVSPAASSAELPFSAGLPPLPSELKIYPPPASPIPRAPGEENA